MLEPRLGMHKGVPISMRVRRMGPYVLIFAVGCWLLLLTGRFNYDTTAGSLGPDAWPRLILILMVAVCAFEIVRLALFWRGGEAVSDGLDVPGPDEEGLPVMSGYIRAVLGLGSIAAYLLAFPYAGFFVGTFVFLTAFAGIAGYRRSSVIVPVAAVLTIGFMFLFMRVIYVSLPIGVEPFSKVSLLVMKLLGVS